MFGLVTQRKYDALDKRLVLTQKELHDIRKYGVIMRKSDMDNLMLDMKKLQDDNEILRRQLERYEESMSKIYSYANKCNYDVNKDYKGLVTEAYWIEEEGKPDQCSNCGFTVYNTTDIRILYCQGCGRLMVKTVRREDEIIKEK